LATSTKETGIAYLPNEEQIRKSFSTLFIIKENVFFVNHEILNSEKVAIYREAQLNLWYSVANENFTAEHAESAEYFSL